MITLIIAELLYCRALEDQSAWSSYYGGNDHVWQDVSR